MRIAWNKGNRKYENRCRNCGLVWGDVQVKKYCSLGCYWKSPKFIETQRVNGAKAKRIIKGRIMNHGYWYLYKPTHPYAKRTSPKGYVYEHRIVMEESLGRFLKPDEIIHHINGIKTDNQTDNLKLTNRHDHPKEHRRGRSDQGRFI